MSHEVSMYHEQLVFMGLARPVAAKTGSGLMIRKDGERTSVISVVPGMVWI
jgi:hypothetical protein